MSLVENFINQISSTSTGGITKPQGFNLNDDTFAKLLEKASATQITPEQEKILGGLGMPAGMIIEPFENTEEVLSLQEPISTEEIEIKDVDTKDYFSSLLSNPEENSDFINMATKHAANAYNIFGKNLVTNLSELVQDSIATNL